jgi:hypothetical protein
MYKCNLPFSENPVSFRPCDRMKAPKGEIAHKPQCSNSVYKLLFPVLVFLHQVAEFTGNVIRLVNFHSDINGLGHAI